MILFLHSNALPYAKFFTKSQEKSIISWVQLFMLVCSFLGTNLSVHGQLPTFTDTWLRADKAVNADPSPYYLYLPDPGVPGTFGVPGGDGTKVDKWWDVVHYIEQDGVPFQSDNTQWPSPYPNGYEYSFGYSSHLSPSGTVPGRPTFRRNSVDNLNHNPVINFDASGNGEGLYFKSVNLDSISAFIVFNNIQGAGDTPETIPPLLGGDVDVHHESSIENQWRTNMSIGVDKNNHLAISRTWHNDSGGELYTGTKVINGPTIATITRLPDKVEDEEVLKTYINGEPDINLLRTTLKSSNRLFFYKTIGKHFNGDHEDKNLNADIAEIILVDKVLSSLSQKQIESYLAIKYGITLNNGNSDYYAMDSTVVWKANPSYRFNIHGLAKERIFNYDKDDHDTGLNGDLDFKLYYSIHQRISTGDIVTISTNNVFDKDNLDQSRPSFSPSNSSFKHNYLLMAHDNASLDGTNIDVPTGIQSRMAREWRVQSSQSVTVPPISGVSLRIDVSGSNLKDAGDCLQLIIEKDGDGEFNDGKPLEIVNATSYDPLLGYVYFDDVDFAGVNVFTLGYGDLIPPTGNLTNISLEVCDVIPPPSIAEVVNADDNCALTTVDPIVFVNDSPLVGSNPGTMTRTYRITDAAGNTLDLQQTINVYTTPNLDPIANVNACGSYELLFINGFNLSGNQAYYDGPNGTGNKYLQGESISTSGTYYVYDQTGISPLCTDQHFFDITITPAPVADAGADEEICGALPYTVAGASAGGFDTVVWTHNGGGSFTDPTVLNAEYNPVPADIGNVVTLTLTAASTGTCPSAVDAMDLTIDQQPVADAGADIEQCDHGDFTMAANSPSAGTGTWTHVSGGAVTIQTPTDPTTNVTGLAAGQSAILRWTITNGNCTDSFDEVTITNNDQPDAGTNGSLTICGGDLVTAPQLLAELGGAPDGGGTWSPALAGAGVYTYTVAATAPCTTDATAQVTVSEQPQPEAGTDGSLTICGGDLVTAPQLFAELGGAPDGSGTWSPALAGAGVYTYTVAGAPPCGDASASVTVTIDDTPPSALPISPVTVQCTADVPAPDISIVTASDDCGPPLVTHILDVSDAGNNPEVITRTYGVEDTAGNSINVQQIITVNDTTDPTASDPAPIIVTSPEEVPTPDISVVTDAADNCSIPIVAHHLDEQLENTINRYYSITDASGNIHMVKQVISFLCFTVSYSQSNESCKDAQDGYIQFTVENGAPPYSVQVNSGVPLSFPNNSFSLDGLPAGTYEISIVDASGCVQEEIITIAPGTNLEASVTEQYDCTLATYSISIHLEDTGVGNDVLYGINTTDTTNLQSSSEFGAIPPGDHFLYLLHSDGCENIVEFSLDSVATIELEITQTGINQISATAVGGEAPYTFYSENEPGSSQNTFSISETGIYKVSVRDVNGCETSATIFIEPLKIHIPPVFTPNGDGYKDTWQITIEGHPELEFATWIFDRYGRPLHQLLQSGNGLQDQGWDGTYNGKELPSGDYWYRAEIINPGKLNEQGQGIYIPNENSWIGNFTLYR
nr:T9SS type B sorting domain-containing protein [Allomuricauda sp.]